MKIPLVQVDAFTSQVFRGNPAAVCPLDSWLDDQTLQAIATENNLSETAFLVGGGGRYAIRWMTPAAEVDLCGHATLASAFVLFGDAEKARDEIVFTSKSGELKVRREATSSPSTSVASAPAHDGERGPPWKGWGTRRARCGRRATHLAVFETEDEVRTLAPDFGRLARVDRFAVIATARGDRVDFVSRFFAPGKGIPEDPVTGSAHCTLIPFWSRRLGKKKLHALQVSPRGASCSARTGASAWPSPAAPSATCRARSRSDPALGVLASVPRHASVRPALVEDAQGAHEALVDGHVGLDVFALVHANVGEAQELAVVGQDVETRRFASGTQMRPT